MTYKSVIAFAKPIFNIKQITSDTSMNFFTYLQTEETMAVLKLEMNVKKI